MLYALGRSEELCRWQMQGCRSCRPIGCRVGRIRGVLIQRIALVCPDIDLHNFSPAAFNEPNYMWNPERAKPVFSLPNNEIRSELCRRCVGFPHGSPFIAMKLSRFWQFKENSGRLGDTQILNTEKFIWKLCAGRYRNFRHPDSGAANASDLCKRMISFRIENWKICGGRLSVLSGLGSRRLRRTFHKTPSFNLVASAPWHTAKDGAEMSALPSYREI